MVLRRLWNKSSYAHRVTKFTDRSREVHWAECSCGWHSSECGLLRELNVEIATHSGATI